MQSGDGISGAPPAPVPDAVGVPPEPPVDVEASAGGAPPLPVEPVEVVGVRGQPTRRMASVMMGMSFMGSWAAWAPRMV
jgi:hypothetical protein